MKISLIAALSLNGTIGQRADQSSLEWTSKEDKAFFVEKTKACGVMIVGRTTFETIGRALPGREMVVYTRHPEQMESVEGVRFTNEAPQDLLRSLEEQGYQDVALIGGTQLYSWFLREGLVTDLFLTLEPVVFDQGIPFLEHAGTHQFSLVEVRKLGNQSVSLHYSCL